MIFTDYSIINMLMSPYFGAFYILIYMTIILVSQDWPTPRRAFCGVVYADLFLFCVLLFVFLLHVHDYNLCFNCSPY